MVCQLSRFPRIPEVLIILNHIETGFIRSQGYHKTTSKPSLKNIYNVWKEIMPFKKINTIRQAAASRDRDGLSGRIWIAAESIESSIDIVVLESITWHGNDRTY